MIICDFGFMHQESHEKFPEFWISFGEGRPLKCYRCKLIQYHDFEIIPPKMIISIVLCMLPTFRIYLAKMYLYLHFHSKQI